MWGGGPSALFPGPAPGTLAFSARVVGGSRHPQLKHKHLSRTSPPLILALTPHPSVNPKAQYPGHLVSGWPRLRGGLGLQPDPPQGRSLQALPSFQALAGASSLGLESIPSPPPCPGQTPAWPLPALSSGGACPVPPPSPCALGWVAEPSHFRDPQEAPLAPGTVCVGLGGWGERPGRGAGEETPHQESQRQGCALPQELPLRPPTCLPSGACCFFPLGPAHPCSELHGPPTQGSPGRSTNGEIN